MKVSELLRKAADTRLWDGQHEQGTNEYPFSCDAVWAARNTEAIASEAADYLEWLGVNVQSTCEFNEFEYGGERQSVRYCWLMFAADLWDEGVRPDGDENPTIPLPGLL